jgi:hypothetical protein
VAADFGGPPKRLLEGALRVAGGLVFESVAPSEPTQLGWLTSGLGAPPNKLVDGAGFTGFDAADVLPPNKLLEAGLAALA